MSKKKSEGTGVDTLLLFKLVLYFKRLKKLILDEDLRVEMPYRILVADDNIINYMLMQESFKIFDVETIRAENGQEAIDICEKEDGISMIFMDIRMPVMDGITASKIISERWPDMKIVAFSAYCGEEFREEALENGCLDFLTKPILIEQIDAIIKEHLHEG